MIATAIPDKSHPDRIAERKHKAKDQAQAIALQSAICDTCLRFKQAFDQSLDLPLQHGIAETMTKLASTWRAISEHRREILGKPRAGSLSPAERAAMRQRKASRAKGSGPKLSSKESLSAPAPSPRSAPAGAQSEGDKGQGVPLLPEAPGRADEPKLAGG